jgi:hypothetical protein
VRPFIFPEPKDKPTLESAIFWLSIIAPLVALAVPLAPDWWKLVPGGIGAGLVIVGIWYNRLLKLWEQAEREKQASFAARACLPVLEYLRSQAFGVVEESDMHLHRVTLFRCVAAEDGTLRLVVFARAGLHPESTTAWPVDPNHRGRCRGPAGWVWYHRSFQNREATVEWKDGDLRVQEEYARSLGITLQEAEGLNVKSRAFAGVPVTVKGQRWGVLLLDTCVVGGIGRGPSTLGKKRALLQRVADLLRSLLEEVL